MVPLSRADIPAKKFHQTVMDQGQTRKDVLDVQFQRFGHFL